MNAASQHNLGTPLSEDTAYIYYKAAKKLCTTLGKGFKDENNNYLICEGCRFVKKNILNMGIAQIAQVEKHFVRKSQHLSICKKNV